MVYTEPSVLNSLVAIIFSQARRHKNLNVPVSLPFLKVPSYFILFVLA